MIQRIVPSADWRVVDAGEMAELQYAQVSHILRQHDVLIVICIETVCYHGAGKADSSFFIWGCNIDEEMPSKP